MRRRGPWRLGMTADGDLAEHGHAPDAMVGHLPPAYVDQDDGRPPPLAAVGGDQTAVGVGRRRGRDTHQAFGVAINAQDVMLSLRSYLEPWEQG